MLQIDILPIFSDNFSFVLHDDRKAAVVDPGQAEPILSFLQAQQLHLTMILQTHHHFDHIGGTKKLQKSTNCQVIGPQRQFLPNKNRDKIESETILFQSYPIRIIAVPGHTKSHLAYYVPSLKALFSGDTLFASGCGRIFEGTAEEMFQSLQTLASLPDDTLIYCGHEYTVENLQFAQHIEPGNQDITLALERAMEKIDSGGFSIPTTLSQEKLSNPFLRVSQQSIKKALGMEHAPDVKVFAELRNRKNRF